MNFLVIHFFYYLSVVVLEIITYLWHFRIYYNEYFYHLPARSLEYIYSIYPSHLLVTLLIPYLFKLTSHYYYCFMELIFICIYMFRQWHPTPTLLPGNSHGWRRLVGCSPWGRQESETTEQLHFHFSLSCIGEGNGNPLQCSCLENPRDGGAWWAAVYGVAQGRTRLKWLSSSSSLSFLCSSHT